LERDENDEVATGERETANNIALKECDVQVEAVEENGSMTEQDDTVSHTDRKHTPR